MSNFLLSLKSQKILFLLLIILGVAIAGFGYFHQRHLMCTQEAKQCADGSYVTRQGQYCTFASCPVHSSTIVSQAPISEVTYPFLSHTFVPVCPTVSPLSRAQYKTESYQERITDCTSIASGSYIQKVNTSRVFISLPEDIYPDNKVTFTTGNATAGNVSNGDSLCPVTHYCWKHYVEFDLAGPGKEGYVNIRAQSTVSGVPDYIVHYNVTDK